MFLTGLWWFVEIGGGGGWGCRDFDGGWGGGLWWFIQQSDVIESEYEDRKLQQQIS